ncbi:MAG: DMT family transporter [Firmicutes bacterium]|nr:DMT family transporter [Bacillota bacterium]
MIQEQSNRKTIIIGCLCAIGAEILYGMSFIFTRQAVAVAGTFPLLGWRFLSAFVFMNIFALTRIIKVDLKGKNLKPLLSLALFFPVIYFICETIGISNTTASESGVIASIIPVVSLIASAVFLRKKPFKRQVFGILITFAGVVITVLAVGASASFSAKGYIFLMIAVLAFSTYSVLVERAKGYSGGDITYVMLAAGAIVFSVIAVIQAAAGGNLGWLVTLPVKEPAVLAAMIYQGLGSSVMAFFLTNLAISMIGVNRNASFIGISTVVSILSGALILGEPFTTYQIIGAAVIIAGVYVANIKLDNR